MRIASLANVSCTVILLAASAVFASEDILVADFEGPDYGGWTAGGDAFGLTSSADQRSRPSQGAVGAQKEVTGFQGKGLVNTYTVDRADAATGVLTSPPFTIERKHVNFLIGGGRRPGGAELRLLLGGQPVRTQTGHANTAEDQERLFWRNWDVSDLAGKTVQIQVLDNIGGGWGHLLVDHILQSDTPREDEIPARKKTSGPIKYPSLTPQQTFSETLVQQEEELQANELMLRFALSRKRLAADPYRPTYHFVSPENMLNDPNGLCFWQGRWHLFYQAYPPDEFPDPKDIKKRRQHWGHTVSDDLVHWRDLPYAIYPGIEKMCFSGGTVVEEDRVVAFYPGVGAGQMVAIADDPLLLNWDKHGPVNSGVGDACIWKEGDTYYGLTGGIVKYPPNSYWPMMHLWTSEDLVDWESRGEFVEKTPLTASRDDGSCPNFQPIGDKHILLFFSHTHGGQYFLGDYDKENHKFIPYAHDRFNHGRVAPGGVHAPSATSDGEGGVMNILNINDGKQCDDWDQIMSLAQRLTLGPDKSLRIEPVASVATLRGEHRHVGETVIPANQEIVLEAIQGNTMELEVEIDPRMSRWVQLNVLRSPDAEEQTSITFYNYDRELTYWYITEGQIVLDGSRSSNLPGVWLRPPERAVMRRGDEALKLRVFIDRSVVEVFAGDRQYLAMRVYPGRKDSVGVSLRAQGQEAVLKRLDAWQMKAIWPDTKSDEAIRLNDRSASASTTGTPGGALFTEDFNGITDGGAGSQWQTDLPLKHSADLPGWTKAGLNSIHAVERSEGNWALQLVGAAAADNVLTLDAGFSANVMGKTYAVAFDAGPSVWASGQQATSADHQLSIELLRSDDSVLAEHNFSPEAWAGKQVFSQRMFTYRGDGSGDLRFRLSPVASMGASFHGAIDNLYVFDSESEAVAAVARRLEAEKRRLEERAKWIAKLTALERDWFFQADENPTVARALEEITWARELAGRLKIDPKAPDLSTELAELDALEKQLAGHEAKDGDLQANWEPYLAVRRVKRRIAINNPALDFTQLLLIDQPYPGGGPEWPHEAIHRLGHRATPGGRLLVLDGLDPDGQVRRLFPPEPGSFWRPELSFDGKRVLFCFKPHDEKSFHLYEINLDGSGLRQLTDSDYDDIDPIYLPDGHIMFTTTRGNTYVRCGPYIYSYVLARCDADGQNVYLVSTNSEPDFVPTLLGDGRVAYSRWEYSDKDQNRVQSLWTTNQDGTGTAVLWGNQSIWPDHLAEPRPMPGSARVMFAGVGHHNWFNGSIGIVDPRRGTDFPHGLTRVTWDLPWGEVGRSPADQCESPRYHASGRYTGYLGAYPISGEDFLVSAKGKGDKFRVYLMDVHGNRELVHEGMHNAWYAIPVKPRPSPPRQPDAVAWPGTGEDRQPNRPGMFYSADVYQGVPELSRGSVKYLRVFQQDAKTYSTWKKTFVFSGPAVSAVQTEAVKRIVSIVPVETDGSVYFEAPAGKSLYFQLLDDQYRALHTMRSFSGVLPGERRACVGCHKMHGTAPPAKPGLAVQRPPTAVSPPPWGNESIGYERFVQPVLDRYCGECHQGDGEARKDCDLTLRDAAGDFKEHFKEPYLTLIGPAAWPTPVPNTGQGGFGLAGAFPVYGLQSDETYPNHPATDAHSAIWRTMRPMRYLSFRSRLIEMSMNGEHYDVKVDPLNLRRLIAWVDANCPYVGEEELRTMDDPEFAGIEQLPVRPRVKTAPVIERP